jgi:hypothetical protein
VRKGRETSLVVRVSAALALGCDFLDFGCLVVPFEVLVEVWKGKSRRIAGAMRKTLRAAGAEL